MEIKEILLSASVQDTDNFDAKSENTDVVVELSNGNKYAAPFFAYGNIEKLVEEYKVSGENLGGKYFYAHNMILVEECTEEGVREVVEDLIEEGEFLLIFKRISK